MSNKNENITLARSIVEAVNDTLALNYLGEAKDLISILEKVTPGGLEGLSSLYGGNSKKYLRERDALQGMRMLDGRTPLHLEGVLKKAFEAAKTSASPEVVQRIKNIQSSIAQKKGT